MLKTAMITLISTEAPSIYAVHAATGSGRRKLTWSSQADAIASAKLVAGPAAATNTISRRGLRSRAKFTGTGLAHPNMKGARTSNSNAGSMMVPNPSMCFRGLKVTRPIRNAVSSPSRQARYPWAAS